MKYQLLGDTGLSVSRLCFGSLTISPLQANLPAEAGAEVILAALEGGVNFIDTAEYYRNYRVIGLALRQFGREVHIASKSYAVTADQMKESLQRALDELGVGQIAAFLLHEQESAATLRGHREALEYLVTAKAHGLVKAIGLSTHHIAGVYAAAACPEIDLIHPLINREGIGIVDGTRDQMLEAIRFARQMGKAVYGMKVLAGGHLHRDLRSALQWAFERPELDSVAVGMKTKEEVEANLLLVETIDNPAMVNETELTRLFSLSSAGARHLLVEEWCQGCGKCVQRCPNKALCIEAGRAVVNPDLCVLCGYCGGVCTDFALKII